MISRTTTYTAMMVQRIRQGGQDDVVHDPVRQESSPDFICGSLSDPESDVFDVMSVSPFFGSDLVLATAGCVL